MAEVVRTTFEQDLAIVAIDSPPVNALGHAVREGLLRAFEALGRRTDIVGVLLLCEGRTFCAGADITEFDRPLEAPLFNEVFAAIEACERPVIAAIHGTALGGGFELSLACHGRVAVPSAKVGLPEVHLGLLPGAGGTQRLPRLVGAARALEMMLTGKPISASQALDWGILDALIDGPLRPGAIAQARAWIAAGKSLLRVRDRHDLIEADRSRPALFDEARARHERLFRGFLAPGSIVEAVRAAVQLPFDQGLAREAALFGQLLTSPQSQAQRYAFFAERETAKVPGLTRDTPALTLRQVGVIGAGTMGTGITIALLDAGVSVRLAERDAASLERGVQAIGTHYAAAETKGRVSRAQAAARMAALAPASTLAGLADADLIIEAVYEDLAVKQALFHELDAIAKPGALLASNTSYLDLDAMAAVTRRPEAFLGLHFFSPANVMRLLEIVRTAHTSPTTLATALGLAKQMGKVPVVSGVGRGFIANRLMLPRTEQAYALTLEGPTPAQIDEAMRGFGFAMGPFEMKDLVGLDVIGNPAGERTLASDLVALGRRGQKSGAGFYDYDAQRRPTASPITARVIAEHAAARGIVPGGPQSAEQVIARLLYPVVNEGARLLEEKIALRASDVDVAALMGFGWPAYRGGPMMWADQHGLARVVAGLRALEARFGAPLRPAALLERLAAQGGALHRA